MPKRQGFWFKDVSEEQIREVISKFTECGWEYFSLSQHGAGVLIEFNWYSEDDPVYPSGYEKQ